MVVDPKKGGCCLTIKKKVTIENGRLFTIESYWLTVIVGIAIICISAFIGFYFNNPYPCSASCCGCSSMNEYFQYSWSTFVSALGICFGIGYIFMNVLR